MYHVPWIALFSANRWRLDVLTFLIKGFEFPLVLFAAVTELVPELIWAPDFFGPQEIWSPRNLVPRNLVPMKFGAREI